MSLGECAGARAIAVFKNNTNSSIISEIWWMQSTTLCRGKVVACQRLHPQLSSSFRMAAAVRQNKQHKPTAKIIIIFKKNGKFLYYFLSLPLATDSNLCAMHSTLMRVSRTLHTVCMRCTASGNTLGIICVQFSRRFSHFTCNCNDLSRTVLHRLSRRSRRYTGFDSITLLFELIVFRLSGGRRWKRKVLL